MGVPSQTSYKYFKNSRTWNEWLKLPTPIKICPVSSQLAVTVWDVAPVGANGNDKYMVPFGGTTIPLFDKQGTLLKGRQKCKLYRGRQADGLAQSSTPAVPRPKRRRKNQEAFRPTAEEEELERLELLFKKHEMDEIPRVDWLDKLVFKAVHQKTVEAEESVRKRAAASKAAKHERKAEREQILALNSPEHRKPDFSDDDESQDEDGDQEPFTLFIELPRWDFPVVFEDYEYTPSETIRELQNLPGAGAGAGPPPEVQLGPGIAPTDDDEVARVVRIYDPEQFQRENPCEVKHRRLIRSERNSYLDRDLKPNAKLRDEINEILAYGPTQRLTTDEKDVMWKFRYYLTKDKRALTKFVQATNWSDAGEVRLAIDILPYWTEINVDSALELLGPSHTHPALRAYAVERLAKAGDPELLLYLLQLVQALKFENYEADSEIPDTSLARFLIDRATNNIVLGNHLHWYLMVECDDKSPDANQSHRKLFARIEYLFMLSLEENDPAQREILLRQSELISVLDQIARHIRFSRESRLYKIERLKKVLADAKTDLLVVDPPLPLPLDPTILITGIYPEESNVFKSSLSPLLLTFKTPSTPTKKYPIIFKNGDDLRQDQLVIQTITLMDRLLQIENLDLKLTPYRILATSPTAGAVQFIPSTSLSAISSRHRGSILAYLRTHNPDLSAPLGIRKDTLDTYIKSCAGYCVITYILGVGDRHLENLLLTPTGHFFHVDFGFILGRDPKPFAPLVKITKEMVEGLGGIGSPQYAMFQQYCFTAYTTLRKSSSLVLNLFSLMVRSRVGDVRILEEQGAVPGAGAGAEEISQGAGGQGEGAAVAKVRERFHLELSEDEAGRLLETVITESVNAVFGVVIDRLHDLVQHWRT